jgi:hypothetical protein
MNLIPFLFLESGSLDRACLEIGGDMGARQLLAVGFRLFAVWLCVGALQFVALLAALRHLESSFGNAPWLSVVVLGVPAGIALLVWVSSGPIASGLMSGLAKVPEPRFSPMDMVAVGCVLMGLWWLKEAVFPLATLWLHAVTASSETGQSAAAWLGARGKIAAAQGVAQIALAAFFVCRPYRIARWILRHAPVVRDEAPEPLHALLRRARELGVRQIARPDIIAALVNELAGHPRVLEQLDELESLLRYGGNPLTRSAAARAVIEIGVEAAVRVRDTAASQLTEEAVPEVVDNLKAVVALADGI